MATHRYPHVMIDFNPPLSSRQHEEFLSLAGIRARRAKSGCRYLVPHHCIRVAHQFIGDAQVSLSSAMWVNPVGEPKDWDHYAEILSHTELQSWVLDGFLTPYQMDAVVQTGHKVGTHFWHPTGAGKTLSGILWCLLTPHPIIVVTRAASRLQYGREFERFTHLRPYVLRPLTKKKQITLDDYLIRCDLEKQRPVVIVAWEALANKIDKLELLASQQASIIFDESHRGKSPKRWQAIPLPDGETLEYEEREKLYKKQEREAKAKGGFIPKSKEESKSYYSGADLGRAMIVPVINTTTASSRLSKAAARVVCTTATPIKDRVRDLWAQLDLAEPYSWGSANVWMHRYCAAKPNKYGGLDTRGESNLSELTERLKECTHSIDYRDTHRHLPPKRRQSMYISPEDQCRPTGGFARELKMAAKRGAAALLECRLAQAASKKRRAVLDLICDHISSGHKIVVFTGRRRDVDELGAALRKQKVIKKKEAQVWAAHGGSDTNERQEIVDKYMQSKEGCVLVGTGDAFGESLNLQDTDCALFTMLPYTPGQIRQWEGRFCRLGQERPVTIYYVIAEDTVDEHVAEILISKMDAVEKVIQDEELAEAAEAIGGTDDEEALFESILAKLGEE